MNYVNRIHCFSRTQIPTHRESIMIHWRKYHLILWMNHYIHYMHEKIKPNMTRQIWVLKNGTATVSTKLSVDNLSACLTILLLTLRHSTLCTMQSNQLICRLNRDPLVISFATENKFTTLDVWNNKDSAKYFVMNFSLHWITPILHLMTLIIWKVHGAKFFSDLIRTELYSCRWQYNYTSNAIAIRISRIASKRLYPIQIIRYFDMRIISEMMIEHDFITFSHISRPSCVLIFMPCDIIW